MSMDKKRALIALRATTALLALAIVTACGGAPAAGPADTNSVAQAVIASAAPAATVAGASDDREGWPETFKVGYFGGDDAEELLRSNEPFRVYLEERLGIPVELFTGTSYSAVIEAMRADRVDAMSVGPFAYILAVQEAQAEALGVGVSTRAEPAVYDPSLVPYYYSAIFTKKGNGITSLEDLRGKDFNFVDPASTSGHLIPKTYLLNNNIDPDTDMTTVFAGSHPTSVIAVWNDKSDAGAATISTLYNQDAEGLVEFCEFADGEVNKARTPEELRAYFDACPDGELAVVALSDAIPNTPFAVRSDLPESFKAAVKDALLDIKDNSELIAQTKRWYLDPTSELGLETLDQMYNPLRDAAKLLDLDLRELE
jgi:phosphonate transport system substrate-binding protein